jgi:hypothetical protein
MQYAPVRVYEMVLDISASEWVTIAEEQVAYHQGLVDCVERVSNPGVGVGLKVNVSKCLSAVRMWKGIRYAGQNGKTFGDLSQWPDMQAEMQSAFNEGETAVELTRVGVMNDFQRLQDDCPDMTLIEIADKLLCHYRKKWQRLLNIAELPECSFLNLGEQQEVDAWKHKVNIADAIHRDLLNGQDFFMQYFREVLHKTEA